MSSEGDGYTQFEKIVIVDVFEDNEDDIREINVEFSQENKLKGIRRSFTIFNDTRLFQSLKSYRNKDDRRHRINLRYIRPEASHDRYFAWRFLIASGVCLCMTLLFVCVWYFTRFDSVYLLVLASLFTAATLIALLLFFDLSHDTFSYSSLAAGVPLIELDNRIPNLRDFTAFVHILEQHIRRAHDSDMDRQQLLAGELREIRRLKDEGMLSEAIYEQARTRIFKHKDYSATR